jgi:hypothetical protein
MAVSRAVPQCNGVEGPVTEEAITLNVGRRSARPPTIRIELPQIVPVLQVQLAPVRAHGGHRGADRVQPLERVAQLAAQLDEHVADVVAPLGLPVRRTDGDRDRCGQVGAGG